MNIIILGCGYLGYNLAAALQDKYPVTCAGINSPYHDGAFDYYERDCFQKGFCEGLPVEHAVVIDAVGMIGNRAAGDEERALKVLADRYRVLFGELAEHHIDRFVFFSSGGTVYGSCDLPAKEDMPVNPQTLYARSKVMLEEMVQECPFPGLILRLANPYGGRQDPSKSQGVIPIMIRKALKGEVFTMFSRPDSVRDYFYIDDLTSAVETLIRNDVREGILNVGSGKGTALSDLIHIIEEETGMPVRTEVQVSGIDLDTIVLDTAKINGMTGWQPVVPLREGIRREIRRIRKEEKL